MSSNDLIDLIENLINDKLSDTHTVTTAKIVKVNNTTVDVKPVYKRRFKDKEIDYPVFTNVPVLFNYGGSNYHAFPLAIGDYCKIIIDERCFDNWYEGLDDKVPLEYRMFDYSDSMAWVSCKPKASAINIPQDGRTHQIGNTLSIGDYEQQGNYVRIGNMNMTGDFTLIGNLNVTGNITITSGDLTVDGISFKSHVHPQNDGNDLGGGVDTGVAK